jgi:acetyl esterase/lipase
MDIESLKQRIVYTAPGMNAVTVIRDLPYSTADDPNLRLDAYRPAGLEPTQRVPTVLFVHGGPVSPDLPLKPKDWGQYTSYGELVAALGLIGVTFNHRAYGRETIEMAADDVAQAVAYVRANSATLQVQADRLAIWTFSGGGRQLAPFIQERPPYVRCLVDYYAALDPRPLQRRDLPPIDDTLLDRISPLVQLQRAGGLAVPMLIARAGQDHPLINQTLDAFVQAALALNAPIELMNHPEGRHGFDTLDDVPRTHDIIARTLAFIRAQLL